MKIGCSFSVDRVAPIHTLRRGQTPNSVDPSLTKDNVILIDELQGRTIEQYTNDEMQKVIDEYNAKQKRKDRRITKPYTEWHMDDKVMMQNIKNRTDVKWAYEAVLCYGNHEDYWHEYFDPNTSQERRIEMHQQAVSFYIENIAEFQKRYPHLHIIYAAIHADEPNGSIHCHLCFQPRATEYQRGLKERISISRALEQDGFEHIFNATLAKENGGFQMVRLYEDFRHNVMNEMAEMLDFEIKEEVHGRKHIKSTAYTELMEKAAEKEKQAEQIHMKALSDKEKAEQIMKFAETTKIIEKEVDKILAQQDKEVIFVDDYKDSLFSKSRKVAIMDRDLYDSRRISNNVEKCKNVIQLHMDRLEAISTKTINAIESEGKSEAEEEIKQLRSELIQKNEIIRKQDKKIKILEKVIEWAEDFINRLGFWNQWVRHKEEQILELKEKEQERGRIR